ncbi:MAG: hypothetical protein ACKPKO_50410, partial [Candidatus Fonsibacter sp.]
MLVVSHNKFKLNTINTSTGCRIAFRRYLAVESSILGSFVADLDSEMRKCCWFVADRQAFYRQTLKSQV